MTVAPILVSGPFNLGPGLKIAFYQTALDGAHAAGGEPVDLSADFKFIYAAWVGGNDTAADNGLAKLDFVLPAPTVAVDATNVLITNYWSPDGVDGEAFAENTGSMSTVGQLSFGVIGA